MGIRADIKHDRIEDLLGGREPGPLADLLAAASVIDAIPGDATPPPGMVARLAAAAQHPEFAPQARPRTRPRRRPLVVLGRIAAPALGLPLVLAGLAFAGVTLPEPARDALERVGIELPNQPERSAGGSGDGTESEYGGSGEVSPGGDEGTRPGKAVGPGDGPGRRRGPNPDPGKPRGPIENAPPTHSNAGGQGNSNAGGQGKTNAGGQGKTNAGGNRGSAGSRKGAGRRGDAGAKRRGKGRLAGR